jgi:hypothetical protein
MSITPERLTEWREVIVAATKRPWHDEKATTRGGPLHRVMYKASGMNRGADFVVCEMHGTEGNGQGNATAIATAVNNFEALLDECERLARCIVMHEAS